MKLLERIAGQLARLCQYTLCVALSVMTVVTFVEVVRRYFFGASYAWAEELVRFLLVWVTFLGGSAAFYTGNLICFDMLTSRVSPRMQVAFALCGGVLVFVILGIFFKFGLSYVLSRPIQFQRSPGLNLPLAYVYISIPVGMGLMIFYNLCAMLRLIRTALCKGGVPC